MTTGPSIWKKENIASITKMGIEGTVAVASLAAAITTILVATSVVAGPAFLASIANPVGIIALFVAATYFAAQAYSSYQQINAIGNANGAPGKDGAPGATLSDEDFKTKLSTYLSDLEVNGNTVQFKAA
ncbi:MAG: hypothetical protein ACR5K9_02670 [Wolbachia sp.]